MANNLPLGREEKLEIAEVLRKGTLSHREIARQFKRSQSTISKLARDAGITPSHRRKRTPAASDVESTYDQRERVDFADRFLGVLDGMISDGGLSPRDAREVAQAAKVVLDARRAEDIEPEQSGESKGEEGERPYLPLMGDMGVYLDTPMGQELASKLQEDLVAEGDDEE
jgi:transposase-like protein